MEGVHNKKEAVVEDKHSLPYPVRTLDPPIRLVDRAREIEQAHLSLKTHAAGKLDVIARQIRGLQEEARRILEQAERDAALHRVQCAFEKRPGMDLHLYEKADGERYFSMLSPEEWGTPPHAFRGTFRLQTDAGFECVREAET